MIHSPSPLKTIPKFSDGGTNDIMHCLSRLRLCERKSQAGKDLPSILAPPLDTEILGWIKTIILNE